MSRRTIVLSIAAALIASAFVPTPVAQAAPTLPCIPLLQAAAPAGDAIARLGSNLATAAARNGRTPEQLRTLAADPTLWLDQCGLAFYVEEPLRDQAPTTSSAPTTAAAVDLTQTFALHSKAGSQRTIYLDFDGANLNGTAWINNFKLTSTATSPYMAAPYDIDGVPTSFSDQELANIQEVWRRVAEDYAAFDVDVTTELPPAASLQRTDSSDQVYGATALITNDAPMQTSCGCGGIAYVGVYDNTGTSHETYQPALVFTKGLAGGTYPKYLAEAASHEVGHNLGLSHDGTVAHDTVAAKGYYTGGAGWAPIMGVGYYESVSVWSKGEYDWANNTEDDYSVMAANGLNLQTDAGDTAASATPVAVKSYDGLISSRTDVDWYSLQAPVSASYTFTVSVPTDGPNLDAKLSLHAADGTLIAASDPALTRVNGNLATGLGASVTWDLTAGTTYLVQVDGVGYASTSNWGSDYGSLGRYTLGIASNVLVPLSTSTATLPVGTTNVAYSAGAPATSGGTEPYSWSLASGALPGGLSVSATTGEISGTPTAAGDFTFALKVTDALGATATTGDLKITVGTPVAVTTTALGTGVVGSLYSATLGASGGAPGYTWRVTSGTLPGTITLDSATGRLSGTPSATGNYSVSFQATDTLGRTASKSLTLTVVNPLSITTGATLTSATLNKNYSLTFSATGGSGTRTWSTTGGLPPGMRLSSTGTLSGKPTARGTYTFWTSVTDLLGTTSKQFTLVVK